MEDGDGHANNWFEPVAINANTHHNNRQSEATEQLPDMHRPHAIPASLAPQAADPLNTLSQFNLTNSFPMIFFFFFFFIRNFGNGSPQ